MSSSRKTGTRAFTAGNTALLTGSLVAAGLTARASEWHPLPLLALLGALAIAGQKRYVTIRSQNLSGAFIALVLACCLLGPTPAMAFGIAAIVYVCAPRRLAISYWIANLATYAVFPLAGGWIVRGVIGDVHAPANAHVVQSLDFALLVFAVFMTTMAINFALIAAGGKLMWARTVVDQVRELLLPLLPAQLTLALLAAVVALAYTNLGYAVWPVAVGLLAMFQYLTTKLVRSEHRLEQLMREATQRASMQIGVLSFNLHGLEARHPYSGHHAAAVARYAEELARDLGCDEEERRHAHAAGLLHDIGKMLVADRILQAEKIDEPKDLEAIRRHPIDGAALVGHFPYYHAIADVILFHHERWDGSGYPDGLIGPEIPLLARILGICEAFDAMTAPNGPGQRRTADEAFAELRTGAGRQFDPDLVERFIGLRQQEQSCVVIPDASLDAELDVERRILMQLAGPRDSGPAYRPLRQAARTLALARRRGHRKAPARSSTARAPR
jgi:putative nucleotidyltransferase with HDIG domain